MLNKKAQGISLTYIVVAAIAVVVLVLVVSMVYGGVSRGGTDIEIIRESYINMLNQERSACQMACSNAKASQLYELGQWRASTYCSRSSDLDLDGDGLISDNEKGIKCWDPNGAYVLCETNLKDGTPVNHFNCTY